MKFVILLLLLTASSFAQGKVESDLATRIHQDVTAADVLKHQISNNIRSGCPHTKEKDISSCFKAQMKTIQITSAAQLSKMALVATAAADRDSTNTLYTKPMISLMMLNNHLSVLDQINVTSFHVNKINIKNVTDYLDISKLRQDEDRQLQVVLKKLITDIQSKMKEADVPFPKRTMPAPEEEKWFNDSLAITKERVSKLSAEKHRFPEALTVVRKFELTKYFAMEKESSLCSKYQLCSKIKKGQCGQLSLKTFKKCSSLNPQEVILTTKENVNTYTAELLKCHNYRWKDILKKELARCN